MVRGAEVGKGGEVVARIRTIKPEFWSDEKLANVCMQARLLYIGMWNLSDDYGVCKGNPNWIKSQLFAYDDITKEQMATWLKELELLGRIVEFDVNGETYYNITNFLKHQRIDKVSPNRNPSFLDASKKHPRSIQDESKTRPVRKGREGISKGIVREGIVSSPSSDHTESIQYFCQAYQNKFGVKYAFDGGKDGALMAGMLKQVGLDLLKTAIDGFFNDPDPWVSTNAGFTVGTLKTQLNKILQRTHKTEQEWTPPND